MRWEISLRWENIDANAFGPVQLTCIRQLVVRFYYFFCYKLHEVAQISDIQLVRRTNSQSKYVLVVGNNNIILNLV